MNWKSLWNRMESGLLIAMTALLLSVPVVAVFLGLGRTALQI